MGRLGEEVRSMVREEDAGRPWKVDGWLELAALEDDGPAFGFLGTINDLPLLGFDGGHAA